MIVGGGLAGLAAAVEPAGTRAHITVLEVRPRLGGASRGNRVVDTGQHVFLRCYTAYRDFLARIPALLGYRALTLRARLSLLRAAELRRVDETDPATDTLTFGSWLAAHGQSKDAIDAVEDLLINAALNIDTRQASMALSAMVLKTALLTEPDAADIGIPTVPLQQLHGERSTRHLTELGADIRLRTRASQLVRRADGLHVRTEEQTFLADVVILAVPKILEFFVTREPSVTFRQCAGSGAARHGTLTRLPGVLLAGAWTATGWPDTMEGAVRSGYAAAREATKYLAVTSRPAAKEAG